LSGNKIQLYGVGFGGGTGGIPQDTIGQLSALRFTALKTLENLMPVMTSLVPSNESFWVNPVRHYFLKPEQGVNDAITTFGDFH
jgi:hypothetical protein